MNIRLLAVKRDGTQGMLEIELPFILSASASDEKFEMYYLHDANGTDHYFNKNDGTYDGWGKAICNDDVTPEEVEGIKCGLGDVRAGRVKSLEQINREIGNTPPLAPGEQPDKRTVPPRPQAFPGPGAPYPSKTPSREQYEATPERASDEALEDLPQIRYVATRGEPEPSGYYVPIKEAKKLLATAAKQAREGALEEITAFVENLCTHGKVNAGAIRALRFYGAAQPSPQEKENVK